jgi:predicted kinase
VSDPSELDRRVLERTQETFAGDVALIASEFLSGFQAVAQIDRPAVTIFGSARVAEGSATYEAARETARLFAKTGLAVVTGGGPGRWRRRTAARRRAAACPSASTSSCRTSRA